MNREGKKEGERQREKEDFTMAANVGDSVEARISHGHGCSLLLRSREEEGEENEGDRERSEGLAKTLANSFYLLVK